MNWIKEWALAILACSACALVGAAWGINSQAKDTAKRCQIAGQFMVGEKVFSCREGR